ncbi:hypothetical protein DXD25_01890 [Prevotella sp. TF12-30]|nr:hypothetical protein [Segatella copri]RGK35599.1 hypothetical protein DXD25_01890 [Prevotella sp. TF12-30]
MFLSEKENNLFCFLLHIPIFFVTLPKIQIKQQYEIPCKLLSPSMGMSSYSILRGKKTREDEGVWEDYSMKMVKETYKSQVYCVKNKTFINFALEKKEKTWL